MFADSPFLNRNARGFLEDVERNEFYFSDASAWEATIKYGVGKMHLPERPELFFADRVRQSEYRHLRIDLRHVTRVYALPPIHGDPFDRLLVSQALLEGLTIVTNDRIMKRYKPDTLTVSDIS